MDKKTVAMVLVILAILFAVVGAVSLSSQPSSTVVVEKNNIVTPQESNQIQLEVKAPETQQLPSS